MLVNNEGCSTATVKQQITIDHTRPGINYPVQYAVINRPLDLKAREFGSSVFWSPGAWLNTRATYTPVFKGSSEQLYTIEIKTNSGCITVDTQMVKTVENVEIYVPSAFSPNKDGMNDYLRPLLRGIKEVRYFRIFNRWGNVIFEMKTHEPGWDGTFKGIPQSTQAVVWMIEGIGVDDQVYRRKGTALLLR
jgi:gliding motility-associated-like protein